MSKKNKTKLYIILISAILLVILLGITWLNINPKKGTIDWAKRVDSLPYDQKITKKQAIADLEYMVDLIKKRHFSAIKGMPELVENQYNEEIINMVENPSITDVWRSSSRILKQLQDAHSSAYYISKEQKTLNLELKFINNVLICNSGDRKGQKITSINNIDIESLYNRFITQFSYENIYYAEYRFPRYLKTKSSLKWLGVECNEEIHITFNDNGVLETEAYQFEEVVIQEDRPEFVRYSLDKVNGIGIFTLDSCNFNDQYKETLKSFFTDVKNENLKNIVVDLRKNGGGNSTVVKEFMKYLPIENYLDFGGRARYRIFSIGSDTSMAKNKTYNDSIFNGSIYVLTSKGTFSSATMFAVLLRDNELCKIIGEPSGNKPSAYGDVLSFQMPYSKLAFSLTYKRFSRPDISKDNEEALLPDYPVEAEDAMSEVYRIIEE